jgi:hypothetical protein
MGLGNCCMRHSSSLPAIIFMLPLVVMESACTSEIDYYIIAEASRSQEDKIDRYWTHLPPQEHLLILVSLIT